MASNLIGTIEGIMHEPDSPEAAARQWKVGDKCFIYDVMGTIDQCEVRRPCDEGGTVEMPADPSRRRWVLCESEQIRDAYSKLWETDRAETEMFPTLYGALAAAIDEENKHHLRFLKRLAESASKLKIRGDA